MAIFTYALHEQVPQACCGGVLAIGNFDGVHLGHQALLTEAARQSSLLGGPSVAVTFDPHPTQLLRPDLLQPPLTALDDRIALLQQNGIDHVLVLQTSHELLHLTAREFFEQVIVTALQARAMVEGFSFGFGRDRGGTIDVLRQLCVEKNVGLTVLPPRQVLGLTVSSSRVRSELLAGAVDVVRQLLGRPYRVRGIVGTGQKRGATLGFPTANLDQIANLVPGNGVYAVQAIHAGKSWPAAANVGPNPTFGETARKVEAHLLGFAGNLYDQPFAVDFVAKIRDTRPFKNASELKTQIEADVNAVKRLLSGTT